MLIVGYCFAIRSERRLCEEVHLNLAYRWFCRLGLEGKVPDHSTFSLNRHGRFRQSNILRHLFESVVRRCMAEGLVGGPVDASLIAADANKQRSVRVTNGGVEDLPANATRAVKDYLARLDDAAFGAADEERPKFVSPSDPAAQWTGALRGQPSSHRCQLKLKCCPNTPHRKIPRDINEEARDVARGLYDTPAFEQPRRDRQWVEMLFAGRDYRCL
jgi:hypothetical protein